LEPDLPKQGGPQHWFFFIFNVPILTIRLAS